MTNTTFNIGIAGGALIGARELLFTSPPGLALTGAALVASALVMLLLLRRSVVRAAVVPGLPGAVPAGVAAPHPPRVVAEEHQHAARSTAGV